MSIALRRAAKREYKELMAQIKNESEEMLCDNRVLRLLEDIDNAVSQNTVSHIRMQIDKKNYRNAAAIRVCYVQPEYESPKVKWSKPEPPKTIPEARFVFEDYNLYFTADEGCSLLYIIFTRYSRKSPRYGEEYDGKPPFRWTFRTLEAAVKYYADSQHTGDCEDAISNLHDVIDSICFPV